LSCSHYDNCNSAVTYSSLWFRVPFDAKSGKRFRDVKHSFGSACRRAQIKDFRFHELRHTFASYLVMAGADIATVKEILGNKSLAMTLRYAHLAKGHRVSTMQMLDEALNGKFTAHILHTFGVAGNGGECLTY
jgi:integrase